MGDEPKKAAAASAAAAASTGAAVAAPQQAAARRRSRNQRLTLAQLKAIKQQKREALKAANQHLFLSLDTNPGTGTAGSRSITSSTGTENSNDNSHLETLGETTVHSTDEHQAGRSWRGGDGRW